MKIFPAIDIIGGKAVRLYKGDYDLMTVYNDNPVKVAKDFVKAGAEYIHIVDLEGARDGMTHNIDIVTQIKKKSGAFCEIGGGIRSMQTVEEYLNSGIDRVIIGTSALKDELFLKELLRVYPENVAVGVDIKDGFVAVKGWLEKSETDAFDFCRKMTAMGVRNLICTDISKDGAMQGTNTELYKQLSEEFDVEITASGGVSSLEDIRKLKEMGIYAAIIGKAYYTGDINLSEAIEVAK